MKQFVERVQKFQEQAFPQRKDLYTQLADGQHPLALFITCSDSRIDPNLVTQTDPGELFVIRNAGNIVPPHGVASGEGATIEYAVAVLKVKDVIVCGHSRCGAMGGLLDLASLNTLPAVKSWVEHSSAALDRLRQQGVDASDPAGQLKAAIEANVLLQLDHLRTHPSVGAALDAQELDVHGWTYEFETGQVSAYVDEQQRFVPLSEAADALRD